MRFVLKTLRLDIPILNSKHSNCNNLLQNCLKQYITNRHINKTDIPVLV